MEKDHQKGRSLKNSANIGGAAYAPGAEHTNWQGGPRQPRPDQKEEGEGRRVSGAFELPLDRSGLPPYLASALPGRCTLWPVRGPEVRAARRPARRHADPLMTLLDAHRIRHLIFRRS
jgi:hypothetical protein